jgi:DNA-binding MarR family transcriptional regulator
MKPMQAATEAAHLIERLDRLARRGEGGLDLNPAQWEALRYVSRANRFSRSPAALADYLGSTRGTVSQTLIALEQKGFLERIPSARDKRSLVLALTSAGAAALRLDPLLALAGDIAEAAGDEAEHLTAVLRATLARAIARNDGKPFGACHTCRHFRPAAKATTRIPYHCTLLNEPLSESDSQAICTEQKPAGEARSGPVN